MLPTQLSSLLIAKTHNASLSYEYRRSSWLVLFCLIMNVQLMEGRCRAKPSGLLNHAAEKHWSPHLAAALTQMHICLLCTCGDVHVFPCVNIHLWNGDKGGVIDIPVSLLAAAATLLSAHAITLRKVWGVGKKKHLFNEAT